MLYVGIDLGTTNSVLATVNEKLNGDIVSKVVNIPRAVNVYNTIGAETRLSTERKATLPSYVFYREENGYAPLVGDFAKTQYSTRPHLVAKSIKSQMGKPLAEGLSPDIPDKTPAQISTNILKHMLKETSKIYKCPITDAVITVPANFDSAMCKATRDSAELAGIRVRNEDGSERPILLSEPNAVIYDLINQIQNGEISSQILDLSTPKTVMVFDLGGGTLDITMHHIQRRTQNSEVLKVDEIATNRYTLLGGDDFDEAIAKEMYKRYLKQYCKHASIVATLKKNEKVVMSQLKVHAEQLKFKLNEKYSEEYNDTYSSGWDDDDDEYFSVGGSISSTGYSYDDTFTKEEIENILSVFMAKHLQFKDFKRISQITDTRNIIYPILDVLKKASDKWGTQDVHVDAVILNGGMSKFYMIKERLAEFFGFEPSVALDPDLAVARGAAVYHYYLHKYEEVKDDMRVIGSEKDTTKEIKGIIEKKPQSCAFNIEWGKNILNDALYLGAKNGAVCEIIPTGTELPYTSKIMTGFRVEPRQNRIEIPIKSQNLDGTYRTISRGMISFNRNYPKGAFVAFIVSMESNKVISMKAWTSEDKEGTKKIEEGSVEIAIDNCETTKGKTKMMLPPGSELNPQAEINNLLQLCKNLEQSKTQLDKSIMSKRIANCVANICTASNKEEFAEVILTTLNCVFSEEAKQRLFVIARKIGIQWSDAEKAKLAQACMRQLAAELQGVSLLGGRKIQTNTHAITALSICGNTDQMNRLYKLHDRYTQACLYTHSRTKTAIEWIWEKVQEDIKLAKNKKANHLQSSAYAIGVALRKDTGNVVCDIKLEERIVTSLTQIIKSGVLKDDDLICSILAIGWICDQRKEISRINNKVFENAQDIIHSIDYYYCYKTTEKSNKARSIALKMMSGEVLNEDEEQFLLTKLEG